MAIATGRAIRPQEGTMNPTTLLPEPQPSQKNKQQSSGGGKGGGGNLGLTATQERNARKRRAKKKAKHDGGTTSKTTTPTVVVDPSVRYLSDPTQAPLVQAARLFFRQTLRNKNKPFDVFLGPVTHWRTLAKLAVRNTGTNSAPTSSITTTPSRRKRQRQQEPMHQEQQQQHQRPNHRLTIGMFAPGTHNIIPAVMDTTDNNKQSVHHPAIDSAIRIVQTQARRRGIAAFCETTGTGQLRHVLLAVQRHSPCRVQCTLVWNGPKPHPIKSNESSSRIVIQQLVDAMLLEGSHKKQTRQKCNSASEHTGNPREGGGKHDFQWHSIWVHYNASWKHDNAILARTGEWELVYDRPDKPSNNEPSPNDDDNDDAQREEEQPVSEPRKRRRRGRQVQQQREETALAVSSSPSSPFLSSSSAAAAAAAAAVESSRTGSAIHRDSVLPEGANDGDTPPLDTNHGSAKRIPGSIVEYLTGTTCPVPVPLHFPPQVFRQGNLTAFTAIVQSIRRYIQERYPDSNSNNPHEKSSISISATTTKPKCLELYGGVGTIGLHVADLCSSMVSSDENPYNVACFERSAQALLENLKKTKDADHTDHDQLSRIPTIEYKSASASVMVAQGEHAFVDIIIVDPPRKGLEDSVSAALVAPRRMGGRHPQKTQQKQNSSQQQQQWQPLHKQTLVYVSCGFDAFQRDYRILTTDTGDDTNVWTLDRAEGHILFPGSDAIETLAFFTR